MTKELKLQLDYAKTLLEIYEQEDELNIEAMNHYKDMISILEKEIKDKHESNK